MCGVINMGGGLNQPAREGKTKFFLGLDAAQAERIKAGFQGKCPSTKSSGKAF